jgi:hypothetical protein
MTERILEQSKDSAKQETSKLRNSMLKSAFTDITSAATSVVSTILAPIVDYIKSQLSSDPNKASFFSTMLTSIKEHGGTFIDKINPFPEIIKSFTTKKELDDVIDNSDSHNSINKIQSDIKAIDEKLGFQNKKQIIETATNVLTSAIPGGSIAKGVAGDVAATAAGAVISKVIGTAIEHNAKNTDFTAKTTVSNISEQDATQILIKASESSLNTPTLDAIGDGLVVASSSKEALGDFKQALTEMSEETPKLEESKILSQEGNYVLGSVAKEQIDADNAANMATISSKPKSSSSIISGPQIS